MEATRQSDRNTLLSADPLAAGLLDRLRSAQALKAASLAMFDPMLAQVAAERDASGTPDEIVELLGRMHGVFSNHRAETASHAVELRRRVEALGGTPASRRASALGAGARTWLAASGLGGQNYGSKARDAFVFEHFEIATLKLISELAERCGDGDTREVVDLCVAQDQEMAATIDRNWTNVLTLSLAASRDKDR